MGKGHCLGFVRFLLFGLARFFTARPEREQQEKEKEEEIDCDDLYNNTRCEIVPNVDSNIRQSDPLVA